MYLTFNSQLNDFIFILNKPTNCLSGLQGLCNDCQFEFVVHLRYFIFMSHEFIQEKLDSISPELFPTVLYLCKMYRQFHDTVFGYVRELA